MKIMYICIYNISSDSSSLIRFTLSIHALIDALLEAVFSVHGEQLRGAADRERQAEASNQER